MPAYRLNVFGFLASRELEEEATSSGAATGNAGFWDQRLALEWTHKNISYFGGNANNITICGYSAGSHSAFHQLAYDLELPDNKSIIRRAVMWSNGPGLQPKSLTEAQDQFDEFLDALNIPLALSSKEKLARLRSLKPETLLAATHKIKLHEFRALSDGVFVRKTLFEEINDGTFARQMRRRGIKIMLGECQDEHFVYGTWRAPANGSDAMFARFLADYPRAACEELMRHYCPSGELPNGSQDWRYAFGKIYADVQIHGLKRGFVDALTRHGAGDLVYRYRINWRVNCSPMPPEWGVTHGTDLGIWLFGSGKMLEPEEKELVKLWLEPFGAFLRGEEVQWATKGPKQVRRLTAAGAIDIWEDEAWEEGLQLWDLLTKPKQTAHLEKAKL
ncbi:hypothetical protein B0A49_03276, partial [Cryomyces minteri]